MSSSVIEKAPYDVPPIYGLETAPNASQLRHFNALQDDTLLILGPRRVPALPCPASNTNDSISILTSVGFRQLEVEQYVEACQKLRPDIAVSIADLVIGDTPTGPKRREKIADRTHAWLRDTIASLEEEGQESNQQRLPSLFATIPPLETEQQSIYLNDLAQGFHSHLSGLTISDSSTTASVPAPLSHLPILCLSDPSTPHDVLTSISHGIDLLTLPFINTASDAGIALTFTFPPPTTTTTPDDELLPLGQNLWSSSPTALTPLSPSCTCYTCTRHHVAYIHHLLTTREMLAWTLLQLHNHHHLTQFFTSIRHSIASGTFPSNHAAFNRLYTPDLPPSNLGQGPRVRGYQVKSVGGGEGKKNPKACGRLSEPATAGEQLAAGPGGATEAVEIVKDMERTGFVERER